MPSHQKVDLEVSERRSPRSPNRVEPMALKAVTVTCTLVGSRVLTMFESTVRQERM